MRNKQKICSLYSNIICSDLNVMSILLSLELINKINDKKMSVDAADDDDVWSVKDIVCHCSSALCCACDFVT